MISENGSTLYRQIKNQEIMTNKIGLKNQDCIELSDRLNQLLSNYQLLYMNVRGFHWNIKGSNFFELHVKFEEVYNNLQLKIDEIAERILTLGYTPVHSYSDYLKHSAVKEYINISDGKQAVAEILNAFDFNKYSFNIIVCEHNFSKDRKKIRCLLEKNGYKRRFSWISFVDDYYFLA